MVLELSTRSQFPDQTVKDIVRAALRNEAAMARFRFEQFEKECQAFEQKYRMATEEFSTKFDAGELGDAEEYFDSTFPHHRHDAAEKAHSSREMSPADAIAESLALIDQDAQSV